MVVEAEAEAEAEGVTLANLRGVLAEECTWVDRGAVGFLGIGVYVTTAFADILEEP